MRQKELNAQRSTLNVRRPVWNNWQLAIGNRQFQLWISSVMGRNLCFVATEQGAKAMCTSKARVTVHRANTRRAKKVRKDISCSNYERLQMRDWLLIRVLVKRHCCGNSGLHEQTLSHIRSPLCIRLSAT